MIDGGRERSGCVAHNSNDLMKDRCGIVVRTPKNMQETQVEDGEVKT
jgi:hypothetical protein